MKCPKCGYENDENALYCGLCYEPLRKIAKTGAPETPPVPEETAKTEPITLLQLALIAGLLSGAGVYFYGGSGTSGAGAGAALGTVRFQEKTRGAENLLAAHTLAREELLEEIAKEKIDPEGFGLQGQYTKKLFKLEEDYANGINALQLTYPRCSDKETDDAYIKWSEDFRVKETAAIEAFNTKYQRLIHKAGAN